MDFKCVHCGVQANHIVCQHLAQSLKTGESVVGFYVFKCDEGYCDGVTREAYCKPCRPLRMRLNLVDGDFRTDLERRVGRSFVCAACFEAAKRLSTPAPRDAHEAEP